MTSSGISSSPDPARFLSRETPRGPRSPFSWTNHRHLQTELSTGLPPLFLGTSEQPSKRRAQGGTSGTSHTRRGPVVGNKNVDINTGGGGHHSLGDRESSSLSFVHLFSAAFLVLVFVSRTLEPAHGDTTVPKKRLFFLARQTPVPSAPVPRIQFLCFHMRRPQTTLQTRKMTPPSLAAPPPSHHHPTTNRTRAPFLVFWYKLTRRLLCLRFCSSYSVTLSSTILTSSILILFSARHNPHPQPLNNVIPRQSAKTLFPFPSPQIPRFHVHPP